MTKLKSIGMFIFTGSSTIGMMNAGYDVQEILEISDEMLEENAYHFIKNYPEIKVNPPSVWDNEQYLSTLKDKNIDVLWSNCPCSGLSQINRAASANNEKNIHFYRVFKGINSIQPKTFLIENAPTLITTGYPILKDMVNQLGDNYKFSIIRDQAGNHNVAMKRTRTLIVGWRKDVFDSKIPLLHANKQPILSVEKALSHLENASLNEDKDHICIPDRFWKEYEHLFTHVPQGKTSLLAFFDVWDDIKHEFNEKDVTFIENQMEKYKVKSIWDKSPYRPYREGVAPSLTSVAKIIHPNLNRQLTIREYATLMNYPDSFKFHKECKTPVIQCIAQGVPANFITYISTEIMHALNNERDLIDDDSIVLNFQHHVQMKYEPLTINDINSINKLEIKKSSEKLNN